MNGQALNFASLVLVDDEPTARALVRAHGSPLLVLDCDRVREQYRGLQQALPEVGLHYAMKALPHPAVIATLMAEGSFFDVATTGEIELLKLLEVSPSRVIHTHPIKRVSDIHEAVEFGCGTFVVDNVAEMEKFVPYRDRVSLVLRVGFRSLDAVVDLSKKFGCSPQYAFALLEHGEKLGLEISGLSFHVGSQCGSPGAHVFAIDACCALIERGRSANLPPLRVLDIGGGFPVPYRSQVPDIDSFCAPIRQALARVPGDVRIIAEPGRFLVATAVQGITTVIGKARREGANWYYLDDGVYGSYSGRLYDGAAYPFVAITQSTSGPHPSVLAGPTCDSVDLVGEGVLLPELQIGDLIVSGSMGAYTWASASTFNSIPRTKILVLHAPNTACLLLPDA